MFERVEIAQTNVRDTEPQMSQDMEMREDLLTQLSPPEYTNRFE